MSKLERIRDGLNAKGIPAQIVNMSLNSGMPPTKKELEETIAEEKKELQKWEAKGDKTMIQIVSYRIGKAEKELDRCMNHFVDDDN